ncbi:POLYADENYLATE-BINDING PROTEIN-INTERACTING PROTEIN 6 [Salix purpurea]|uniref:POLYADENYLATE-BINDING PROTEIN-INTERACTING PROTEIN 6 n=1 Tax=Salix purpurea TaxID=77065 RepID=A0A9Q0ULN0_SALPP|nr:POLYADENYLATE-BINDING PROTEIN-INTERACTING PROTEIN 6 [Salix purpurea]
MKPGGVSSLNPYAASYTPLSKKGLADRIETPGWTLQSGNQSVWYGSADHNAQSRQNDKGPISVPEVYTKKIQSGYGFYSSLSQNLNEVTGKQMVDEEFEMDLDYLRINFPGMSDGSLTDVYMANKGDLEAAVDMLNQLEFDTVESSGNLPDTLDIGDVSESRPSAESSSMKLKTVVGEASTLSGSSAPDTVILT